MFRSYFFRNAIYLILALNILVYYASQWIMKNNHLTRNWTSKKTTILHENLLWIWCRREKKSFYRCWFFQENLIQIYNCTVFTSQNGILTRNGHFFDASSENMSTVIKPGNCSLGWPQKICKHYSNSIQLSISA